ncbi:NCS2 family permease [Taylorella equigenitalis]|uniref:NCS2 family permease n=1 Tax=Taylorella equigenitalis TaxID=29575 RepID=UPI000423126B|nr:NCS2 family permease [Taylorella equigenitalis]ASY40945.1 guanine permease [Taylorella equigenitalis]
MFEKMFKLSEHHSNRRTEVLAGITTFLTMSYIIFVNPNILGTTGMDTGAVFVATCLAAAVGSFIMAFLANWPIGMAPGMGLNAFFAFGVVGAMGYTWQQALAAVFLSGVIFMILTLTGARRWLIEGIPQSLRSAIVAGIGLFLAFIGFQSSGIVVDNPATLTGHGDFSSHQVKLAIVGFFLIVILDCLRVRGAILIGILSVSILSIILGHTSVPHSIISSPPSISSTFLALDIPGVMEKGLISVLLVFVLVEVFDATGTMIGVAKRANLLKDGPNHKSNLGKALMADSAAILAGSIIGTSSTTAYVESMSGVQSGGRTGLTAFVIGLMFLLALFFSPLAAVIPAYATAPALIYVALLMLREITEIDWEDMTEVIPSAITLISMPFTYSIAEGMAFGFISYVVIKVFTLRYKEVHPATTIIAGLFILRFAIA